jgi:hypothetical protein
VRSYIVGAVCLLIFGYVLFRFTAWIVRGRTQPPGDHRPTDDRQPWPVNTDYTPWIKGDERDH